MNEIRLMFNVTDRRSDVLFDKHTKTRFSKLDPIKVVPYISDNMRTSIKSGRIIDIDNITGIELNESIIAVHNRLLDLAGITREPKITDEIKEIVKEVIKEDSEEKIIVADTSENEKESKKKSAEAKSTKEEKESKVSDKKSE